jgi:hypothetical protein
MPNTGIDGKLRELKDQLEQLRGRLESFSTAIWQDIDHEDADRLEAGVRFKHSYNERRASLEEGVGEMLALLHQYPESGPGKGAAKEGDAASAPPAAEQAPASPGPVASAPVASGLEQKAPFGFVLGGQTYTSASAWPLFYEALLQELYNRAPEKLSHLADAPAVLEYGSRPLFARVPDQLDDPLPVADAIFAEADLSPEALLQVIKRLISHMGYPLESFKILLKEKNRGTVETLSIAA